MAALIDGEGYCAYARLLSDQRETKQLEQLNEFFYCNFYSAFDSHVYVGFSDD